MKTRIFTDKHGLGNRFQVSGFRFQGLYLKSEIWNPASGTIRKSVFICVNLWLIIFSAFQISAQNYKNPVIPGDFPDPSVIRVGKDFYATATTGDWSPSFPILHSTDLINWQTVGAVFDEKPAWAKGDFWAPEIIQDKEKFYVFYAARRDDGKNKKGTLCVAVAVSDKPDGGFQDKGALVCQEMGSIDPFFVRDENGLPFLIWKEDGNDRGRPTWLYAQQLDENLTKLVGKPAKLFRNTDAWEKNVVEGSYILRRNGWFYHFYSGSSCCGRACDYALGVARSKTLLGKWEKNPANPILKENETWQCPGHGSIVTTTDGRAFLLYHAYGKSAGSFNIGRQALLDEVKFADGWATINNGRGPSENAAAPFGDTRQQSIFANSSDEFNENKLAPLWNWSLAQSRTAQVSDGFLNLAPTAEILGTEKTPEIIAAERTVSGNYKATTRIDIARIKPDEFAGLSVYSWRGNAVGASVGGGKIFVWRRENRQETEISKVDLPSNQKQIYFKTEARNGENFQFFYSVDGTDWKSLGDKVNGNYVEGARVALIYDGRNISPGARFDWVRVEAK